MGSEQMALQWWLMVELLQGKYWLRVISQSTESAGICKYPPTCLLLASKHFSSVLVQALKP